MSSTPAADLIDKHNAARKRIAELEEIIEEWRAERDSIREEREQLKAENQRLRDTIAMYESWMKRKPGREWGTVWNDICRDYPYLAKVIEDQAIKVTVTGVEG